MAEEIMKDELAVEEAPAKKTRKTTAKKAEGTAKKATTKKASAKKAFSSPLGKLVPRPMLLLNETPASTMLFLLKVISTEAALLIFFIFIF